jgi:peptide/nickel transport system ATP-binding protein/oligopeptide transport system ATP-binding protein
MDRFIEIKNLVKLYYGHGFFDRRRLAVRAVDKVSLSIQRNTVFGLVGESGCGKTTLARALLYLDPPTSGEVWFDGTLLGELSANQMRAFRKRMQIVFQDPNSALNPRMRIGDSLAEGMINRGLTARQRTERSKELLDLVGIAPANRGRYPHEFSGGQKQRIVIARALTMEPDFMALDEPVSNLDVSIQAQIINLLLDLKKELSLTYLFISHDLNLVAFVSDQIGVMYNGKLVELASTDQMMANPCHPYTLKLFSSVPGKQAVDRSSEDMDAQGVKEKPPVRPPDGCLYVLQCPMATQSCRQAEPELREITNGHQVSCFKI